MTQAGRRKETFRHIWSMVKKVHVEAVKLGKEKAHIGALTL